MQKAKNLIQLIKIPEIFDDCYLYFAQVSDHIPFSIKRVYYITKAQTNLPRGLHAHKKNQQVIFCISGSVKLVLDDGKRKKGITLSQANVGVFIDKMIWHEMLDFKKDTILLILASEIFDEKDYIRDYEQFKTRAR